MTKKKMEEIAKSYQFKDVSSLCLGGIMFTETQSKLPPANLVLKTLNRHGLISGATGSGKTKTIQMLAEQLSKQGIPSIVMDMKGDLSGLAEPGDVSPAIEKRQKKLDLSCLYAANHVAFLDLSQSGGVCLRGTISELGPILLSKMLTLNETQSSILSILFQYAKNNQLPLIDLADLKAMLQFADGDEKASIEKEYGKLSSNSLKAILRHLIELEMQGGEPLFGELSFDVNDLINTNTDGQGLISIIRLMDIQDKPKLFSMFMLGLLTKIYKHFPEEGDLSKPKLMFFIDEAHLIFDNASRELLSKLNTIIKLIRSKGVGIIFCTQTPKDIPDDILSQLGLKIQHALRAFTAKDRKAIKLIAENFPESSLFDTETLLTSLGVGEALITTLDDKAQPTPLVPCLIRAPLSKMGTISDQTFQRINNNSLVKKYKQKVDVTGARAILEKNKTPDTLKTKDDKRKTHRKTEKGTLEKLSKNTLFRQVVRTIARESTRAIMALFKIKK